MSPDFQIQFQQLSVVIVTITCSVIYNFHVFYLTMSVIISCDFNRSETSSRQEKGDTSNTHNCGDTRYNTGTHPDAQYRINMHVYYIKQ